jgi:hypothetical protein
MKVSDTPQRTNTVKYHKHGRLFEQEEWTFVSGELEVTFTEDMELVDIFDGLSMDGYDLVCSDGSNGFILRSKEKFEETEEWFEFDDEK